MKHIFCNQGYIVRVETNNDSYFMSEDEELEYEEIYENTNAQVTFEKRWPELKKHLFNVAVDPEERIDLKKVKPEMLERLRQKAYELFSTIVNEDFPDPVQNGKPKFFNNIWSPGWC